jgi:F-type H+-transporting ATPase subunit b
MELFKLLSTNEIVAQVANFLLLFFFLRIFFWKRILKLLDERKARIASELKAIEDTKAQVQKLKSEYQMHLDNIEETSREKLSAVAEEGKLIVEQLKKEAHEQAQQIIETAKEDIKVKLTQAKEQLRGEIVDLTIKATENLISEKLTDADDKKLVEDFLRQVDKI